MAARTIKFEGKNYQFPDDATEQEISEALAGVHDQGPPANVTNDPRMENPLSNAHISPPESGVGGFFSRKLASVKTALGGNKPERGSGSGAVDLVGGPAIGPLHVAHGITQMPRHPVQGFNEAVGGVAQTASLPLAVAAPAAIPMSLPYVAGAKAGAWGLSEAGMDPDNAEALSNLVTMGIAGRGPLVRGTGKVLEKVGGVSDIPELPFPSKTGAAARMFNTVKRPIGQAGRKMANYGVPQAPNVFEGNVDGPLPGEPDLPTPVKPDGAAHHNDVTDHGELDKLLDQVSQQPEVRQGRDPVRADDAEHHNDINPGYAAVDAATTKIVGPLPRIPKVTSRLHHGTLASNVPDILENGIQPGNNGEGPFIGDHDAADWGARNAKTREGIKQAGGWLEYVNSSPSDFTGPRRAILDVDIPHDSLVNDNGGGMENALKKTDGSIPVSRISGISYQPPHELPESPLTKSFSADDVPTPNSDTLLRAIQSAPGWPENGLPNEPWDDIHAGDELSHALDTDPYNRPSDRQVQSPNYSGAERRGFSRSVGGLSDTTDNDDFQTAKRSLGPDATPSQLLLEAQRLKMERAKGGK